MIAVIFEVEPADGQRLQYLDLAAALKPELETINGFVSIERFQSLADDNKILSLSFFEDEDAVKSWRNRPSHRLTQGKGRNGIFNNYRLRIAQVDRDYGLNDRAQAPADSKAHHG